MTLAAVLLLILIGFCAGGFGALAGVGGGIIVTPLLAIYFGLPMHQAIGITLLCVIATSTATSSLYVERHVTDVRLGMTLELATTTGALIAALIAHEINRRTLAILFACFLFYSSVSMVRKAWNSRNQEREETIPDYTPQNYPLGLAASLFAGGFSGLLGIGGGPVKVPVMFLFMKVPLRVAAATSNFMIGVTAATSAYIYWGRGDVRVDMAAPLVAGVFTGSLLGARISPKVRSFYILLLLIGITGWLALQMTYKLLAGGFR
ncbi:MAG TPA: sulfite exporter TauE/SafE family protein [Candidatus Angelobacter sp.]|nr:sulfite exporter TauE/SafE family protein [Candidatus Angelobacter sp.]